MVKFSHSHRADRSVRTSKKNPRILLADDHPMVLEGVAKLVEEFGEVVGKVEDGRALLEAAPRLRPDVVVMDISMPRLNGLETARYLQKLVPHCKIIFLTMHADPSYIAEAFEAGASGYLLKQSAGSELKKAVQAVLMGGQYVALQVRKKQAVSVDPSRKDMPSFKELTPRQREVLQLVAEGCSTKSIAASLNISVKTVEFHKSRIMETLNIYTVPGLTKFAIMHGLGVKE